MTKRKKNKGLGRGIDALFSDPLSALNDETTETPTEPRQQTYIDDLTDDSIPNESVQELAIKDIRPNPYQPRQHFDEEALAELAESIKASGLLQPIIVRQSSVKGYELIAGERRTRASQLAGMTTIPAIVRQLNDEQMIALAVVENLQREDLTPLEEAAAYRRLMDQLNITQKQASERLGKSRSYIANMLRLLDLNDDVKQLVQEGKLSAGQARTLLGLKSKKEQSRLAHQVVEEGMTVRELEKKVSALNEPADKIEVKPVVERPAYLRENEDRLMDKFGTNVQIKDRGDHGKIEIEYLSEDDLMRILDILEIRIDD